VAVFEILEHALEDDSEHILQILVAIEVRIHVQVIKGARWCVGVEIVPERDGVWIADGIIGVAVGLRDRGGGGAVLRRRSRLLTIVLGCDMLVSILDNEVACARVLIVDR
jgi:hypothetical protein